jgi:hypothetical protein
MDKKAMKKIEEFDEKFPTINNVIFKIPPNPKDLRSFIIQGYIDNRKEFEQKIFDVSMISEELRAEAIKVVEIYELEGERNKYMEEIKKILKEGKS